MLTARAAIAGVAVLVSGAGCATKKEPVAVGRPDRPLYAVENFGTLETTLDEPVPVRSVVAAAEAAFRDRGYMVVSRRTTDEAGRVEARAPSREFGRTWTVLTRATTQGGTTLSVRAGGWDNDAGAHVMLDAILQRLGR